MLIPDPERRGELRVKVLDFGIAKLAGQTDARVQTETGAMIGTPAYMAPEQCVADPKLDGKADVYALGIMLYEMLADRLPYDALHSFDFMAAHVRSEPKPLLEVMPDIPIEVANLVHSMLSKRAIERPSMEAVVNIIDQLRAALPPGWGRPAGRGLSGHPVSESMAIGDTAAASGRPSKEMLGLENTVSGAGTTPSAGRISKEALASPLIPSRRSGPMAGLPAPASGAGATPAPGSGAGATPPPAAPAVVDVPMRSLGARVAPIIAVAVVVTAAIVMLVLRPGVHPSATPTAGGVQAGGPAVRQVHWVVTSVPAGAEVVRADGQVLGSTPWEVERPAGPGETVITLRHWGCKDKTILLSHSTDLKTEIQMEALPAAAANPPATAEPTTEPTAEPTTDKAATGGKRRKGHGAGATKGADDKDGKSAKKSGDVELLD